MRFPAAARIRRTDLALLSDPELRGALARRGARRADRDHGDRDPQGRVFDLYRRVLLLQTVYGALAAIPIFLLWMYISWMAVLLGAVVAAALPNWRIDERVGKIPAGGVRLGFSLALIAALARAQRRGEARSTPALAAELGVATTVIDEHIRPLAEAGFAAHTQEGRWVLAWSPETATLHDLYEALHLPLAGRWTDQVSAPWQRQVAPAMDRIVKAETAAMQVTIASLLAEISDPGKPFAEVIREARSDRPFHARDQHVQPGPDRHGDDPPPRLSISTTRSRRRFAAPARPSARPSRRPTNTAGAWFTRSPPTPTPPASSPTTRSSRSPE